MSSKICLQEKMADIKKLEALFSKEKEFNLASMFPYFQYISSGLESVTRYKRREDIAGQSVKENNLHHSYKMALITIMLTIKENERRLAEEKLDIGILVIMAIIHDIAEITQGDIASFEKKTKFKDKEYEAFTRVIEPLPLPVKEYLVDAFRKVIPGSKYYAESEESRFFKGIEQIEHLSRALHECRQGNLHFGPKFIRPQLPVIVDLSKEFTSLIGYAQGFMIELESYEKEFEKKREYYLKKYKKHGHKEETFPF